MDELVLVRIVLDRSLTVSVMHWQAMNFVVANGGMVTSIAMMMRVVMVRVKVAVAVMVTIIIVILFWVLPMVWLVTSHSMMSMPMS